MDVEFQKSTLENGVRVITERLPFSRVVSTGIWTEIGTRYEPLNQIGISHFIEHMVFKGTKTRTPYQIVSGIESVGGDLNAFTTREETCFHVATLKEYTELGIEILSDIVRNAVFPEGEIEKERQVVLQEIAMTLDSPEEYIYDLFFKKAYPEQGLGRPILGSVESVKQFDSKVVKEFFKTHYCPSNWIVSVAGDVEHGQVVDWVSKYLESDHRVAPQRLDSKSTFIPFESAVDMGYEQSHLLIGFPTASYRDEKRFEAVILNSILGGGMTSRLYQKVREEAGLAYSVYSHMSLYLDSGVSSIYCGTDSTSLENVKALVFQEFENVKKNGITKEELRHHKTQLRGSLLMSADDPESRMQSLGLNEIVFSGYKSIEKVIEGIDQVSVEGLNAYAVDTLVRENMGVLVLN